MHPCLSSIKRKAKIKLFLTPFPVSGVSNWSLIIALENMNQARKLFRLFKSALFYTQIRDLLANRTMASVDRQLQILLKLALFFYCLWDNITVLNKIKFFNFIDPVASQRYASKWRHFAIIIGLIISITGLLNSRHKKATVREQSLSEADY